MVQLDEDLLVCGLVGEQPLVLRLELFLEQRQVALDPIELLDDELVVDIVDVVVVVLNVGRSGD